MKSHESSKVCRIIKICGTSSKSNKEISRTVGSMWATISLNAGWLFFLRDTRARKSPAARKIDMCDGGLSCASTREALPLGNSTHATEGFYVPRRVRPCHSEIRHMWRKPFTCLDACGLATRKLDRCQGSLSCASTRAALPARKLLPWRVRPCW